MYRLFLILVLLAVCYDKPLIIISSIDKLNPRFIDVALIVGIALLIYDSNGTVVRLGIFKIYGLLIFWFCLVFCLGVLLMDDVEKNFLTGAALLVGYIKELVLLVIVITSLQNSDNFHFFKNLLWLPLIIVYVYTIYEFFTIDAGKYEVAPGKFILKQAWTIYGPFSPPYFSIANAIPILTFLFWRSKAELPVWQFVISATLSTAVMMLCGSRLGLILMICFLVIHLHYVYRIGLIRSVILFSTVGLLSSFIIRDNIEVLGTVNRINLYQENSESENSLRGRMEVSTNFRFDDYDYQAFMPFIGAGFNVATKNGVQRIEYGVHNIFLYPLEQAGLMGFIIFLLWVFSVLRTCWLLDDKSSFFAVMLLFIVGLVGHSFWRGFATGNINFLRLLFIWLLIQPKFSSCHITDLKKILFIQIPVSSTSK